MVLLILLFKAFPRRVESSLMWEVIPHRAENEEPEEDQRYTDWSVEEEVDVP